MPDRLAIYRLGSDGARLAELSNLGRRIFDINEEFQLSQRGNSRILRSGRHVVELANESGGCWAADEAQLWKPGVRSQVPSARDVLATAERLLNERQLLPKLAGPFRLGDPVIGGTLTAQKMKSTGQRENRRLDYHVTYPVMVGDLPIVGGGGSFKLTVGHLGRVTGYAGVWRPPGESFDVKVIDRGRADEQYRALTQKMNIASFEARLAYYSAPSFHKQDYLYPVYVYSGTAVIRDQRVPLREVLLPATEIGPAIVSVAPQSPRRNLVGKGVKRVRPRVAAGDAGKNLPMRRSYRTPTLPWEAGTEWIGLSGGLPGSRLNAQGFVDEWAAAGWHIDFNWGDGNAWESDWTSDDDNWVDNVDFLFYTGHANGNGWVLAPVGGDGWLNYTEPGPGPEYVGDLWGQSDLEWMVVAACGPLQDDLLAPGGGDVFQRWSGAFDGLHILLGYATVTQDNEDEGRKLAQYCKGGATVIDSWFRTAGEIQPPDAWVGAMWVGQDSMDPAGDHAWGYGSVSGDPHAPTWYAAMWTTC